MGGGPAAQPLREQYGRVVVMQMREAVDASNSVILRCPRCVVYDTMMKLLSERGARLALGVGRNRALAARSHASRGCLLEIRSDAHHRYIGDAHENRLCGGGLKSV